MALSHKKTTFFLICRHSKRLPVPVGSLSVQLSFQKNPTDLTADFCPRHIHSQTIKKSFQCVFLFSHFLAALSKYITGIYLIFQPSGRIFQQLHQHSLCLRIPLMIIQFSPVIKLMSWFQLFSFCQHFFIDLQIPVRISLHTFPVLNFDI